jgi:hypothetical protein
MSLSKWVSSVGRRGGPPAEQAGDPLVQPRRVPLDAVDGQLVGEQVRPTGMGSAGTGRVAALSTQVRTLAGRSGAP